MQVTTLSTILSEQWEPDKRDYCLYLIRDGSTILYVEQAHNPCQRIKQQLGQAPGSWPPSQLGRWILDHAPRSLALRVELLSLADIPTAIAACGPPSLRWWTDLAEPSSPDGWEAVYRAEFALIRYYRPCFNEQYNQGAGRTPFPADDQDLPAAPPPKAR